MRAEWIEEQDWYTEWEHPRNLISGESYYMPALLKVSGLKTPGGDGINRPVEVAFTREPTNPHDRNAFAAHVAGQLVGHLRAQYAAAIATTCDQARCREFVVCGFLRGGAENYPNIGCHIWPNRRLTSGPVIAVDDDDWTVPWPPPAHLFR